MREREKGARNIEEAFCYCSCSKNEQVRVGIRLHLPDRCLIFDALSCCLGERTITETVKINGSVLEVIKNLFSALLRVGQERMPKNH